jgi:phosphoribosylglycinamide formyltransferase 1
MMSGANKSNTEALGKAPALKIGVLISGGGSNLQAIIDAINAGTINVEIVQVISSRPNTQGVLRAKRAGIPTKELNKEVYETPAEANRLIAESFLSKGAEYVVMAGYMRKVTSEILDAFPRKVINLHPALLPAFIGAHAIRDAFDYGVKVTGVSVHFANAEYDKGPIIAQRSVEIYENDTLESLEERIHEAEHQLYPHVLGLLADKRIVIDPRGKVHVK